MAREDWYWADREVGSNIPRPPFRQGKEKRARSSELISWPVRAGRSFVAMTRSSEARPADALSSTRQRKDQRLERPRVKAE